jgi:putative membrane protein
MLLLALCCATVPLVSFAQEQSTTGQSTTSQSVTPQRFVQEAAMSGLKEVRLGQIALLKAQDSDVKQFAQQMVQDHSTANQKLTQIARSKGFTIPSTNTFSAGMTTGRDRDYVREGDTARPGERPTTPGTPSTSDRQRQTDSPTLQQEMQSIQRLQAMSGTEFDKAYINEMVKDHTKAVQKFETASQNLQDQELKQFVQETLPKLQEHHKMAQQLSARLNGTQNQNQGTDERRQEQKQPEN